MKPRDLVQRCRWHLEQLPDLLRRAHADTLAPRSNTDYTRSRITGGGGSPPSPKAGDESGWLAYRKAADELVGLFLHLRPDFTPPAWWRAAAPNPHQAAHIARSLLAFLPPDADKVYPSRKVGHVADRVQRIHSDLVHVTGSAWRPPPVRELCETANCTNDRENGRRCWFCTNFKRRNGEYPVIARTAS